MRKKVCTKCGVEKSIRCFKKVKPRKGPGKIRNPDQRSSWCKECRKKTEAERRKSYPDVCEKSHRTTHLRRYGLTIETYNIMFQEQSGKCKICGTTNPGGRTKYLMVDHDHKTGRNRGLLCNKCNQGLGHFKDDMKVLEKAIQYLHNSTED